VKKGGELGGLSVGWTVMRVIPPGRVVKLKVARCLGIFQSKYASDQRENQEAGFK